MKRFPNPGAALQALRKKERKPCECCAKPALERRQRCTRCGRLFGLCCSGDNLPVVCSLCYTEMGYHAMRTTVANRM